MIKLKHYPVETEQLIYSFIFVFIGHVFHELFTLLDNDTSRVWEPLSVMGIVDCIGVAIICAGVYGSEFNHKTMERTLTIGKDRKRIFLEKMVASFIMSIVILLCICVFYTLGWRYNNAFGDWALLRLGVFILPAAVLNPMLYWGPFCALWLRSAVHGILTTAAVLGLVYTFTLIIPPLLSVTPEYKIYDSLRLAILVLLNLLGGYLSYRAFKKLEV